MAYLPKSAWIAPTQGGISPETYGISGRFNAISGLSGLGQACDSMNFAAMTPDQWAACGYTDAAGNLVNLPTTSSTVAGIPSSYLVIGAAILGGIVLLGAFKR